jgi:hypothetical protein
VPRVSTDSSNTSKRPVNIVSQGNPTVPVFVPIDDSYNAHFHEISCLCGCGGEPDNRSPLDFTRRHRHSPYVYRAQCQRLLIKRFGAFGYCPADMIMLAVKYMKDHQDECLQSIANAEPTFPSKYWHMKSRFVGRLQPLNELLDKPNRQLLIAYKMEMQ